MAEPHEEFVDPVSGSHAPDARWRRLLDLCKDVFLELDAAATIRDISPAVQDVTGHAISELLAQPFERLCHRSREGRRLWTQLNRHGQAADVELALRHKNGDAVPCLVSGTLVREHNAFVVTLLLHKITESESAQRALRDSEQLYRNLVEMAPDSIAVLDLKGRIISSNEAACGIGGYTLEEVLGKPFWEIGCFRLSDIPKYIKLFYSLIRGKPAPPMEFECFSKDGTPQILESRIGVIKKGRRTVGLQVISRNVTERKRTQQVIQQAEERLRTVLDAAGIGWWYFDLETGDFEVDQRCRELVNLPPDSHPSIDDLFGQLVAEDRPRIQQTYADAKTRSGLYSVECRTEEVNGQSRWLHVKGRAVHVPGQRHIEGIVVDITDRKTAEEALRESELKFRSVFENALDAMFLTMPDGTIAAGNPAACALFGMSQQELIEAGRDGLLDTSDPALAIGLEQRRRFGKVNTELTCIRKDGARFRAEVSSVVLPEQPPRAFAVLRDITERKRAEEILRESEARSRLIIETIPALAWQTSADGKHIECNRRWFEYTGQTPQQVQAYGWLAAVHPDDLFRVAEVGLRAGNLRQPYEVEYRLKRASDGSFRWHLARALPVVGENGEIDSWFGSATDIEDLKRAQEVLRRDRDEQLERHRAELAHVGRLSVMGELAAGLAHELNQPLHAIANYARGCVLRMEKQPEMDRQLVQAMEQVTQEAHRAAEIVRRVRRFVEKRAPQFSPVSVNKLIEEVLLLQDVGQTEDDVRIELALADNLPLVLGDPIQIQQVLMNLIRNGVEAMEQTPSASRVLTIETRQRGELVCIAIRDRGPGISEEDRVRIFEPFYTTKPTGLGMGLVISRSIAQAHGGRLDALRNETQGSTFQFCLPAAPRT